MGIFMIIYVVQVGDTITSISNQFGVSEIRLITENGILNPDNLVPGQTIVISYPQETYVVNEGDTLSEIAMKFNIPILQLYRNNPYLWEREYIYPGEELILSFDTITNMTTNAYVFPYIDSDLLRKSLPYLTYLSVLNYKTLKGGEIQSYYDDSDLIKTAKQFGVAPLMLLTSVSFQGERNPEVIYEILLNPDYQDNHAQNMLKTIKEKGYYGLNITITFLTEVNQELYLNYLKRITSYLNKEGYPVFITLDPNFTVDEDGLQFEKVNYMNFNDLVENVYVMRFFWGTQYVPPMPIGSVRDISEFTDYLLTMIEPQKISVGFPLMGYDWTFPFIQNFSVGNAITLETAIEIALTTGATIMFDEESKTPYYEYEIKVVDSFVKHIVWFVDARTIYAIVELFLDKGLDGTGLWNIMSPFPQLWLIINSTCNIEKVLPDMF